MNNIYAALEIGTTRTVLAIGEAETGGRLKVTCHAEIPSTGVRKSQILDINQAVQSIRSVLRETEKIQLAAGSSITIGNAFLVVSGQHIKADPFQGMVPVEGGKVNSEEIDGVNRSARTMQLPKDRELLDIVREVLQIVRDAHCGEAYRRAFLEDRHGVRRESVHLLHDAMDALRVNGAVRADLLEQTRRLRLQILRGETRVVEERVVDHPERLGVLRASIAKPKEALQTLRHADGLESVPLRV